MRVRNRKGAQEMLDARPDLVLTDPTAVKGRWHEIFGNMNPIHIEVGSGKGRFITGMAERHPDINYIAIDMQKSVLSHVLDKVVDQELSNVRLLLVDGSELTNYFASGEVGLVYLNFSDPWPKKRHEKRRLTYRTFLETYQAILPAKGEIHFKTDNRGLFEYSLVSMSQYGMLLKQVWLDLHASDFEGNVLTEYEEKFSSRQQAIYRLEAQFQD